MFRKLVIVVVLIVGFWAARAIGQTTTGLVTGTVLDSSGAVVTGAEVDLTNQGTGEERKTTSGNNGIYLILQVPPGVYSLSVQKQGFATETRNDVRLEVNQSATVDFKLAVSSTAQTITVTGAAPLLNTISPTLSDVVSHEAVVDLPLNGRNFTQLALLTPGAVGIQDVQQSSFTVTAGGGGVSPSVNGQQGYQNNYTMDGILNNSVFIDLWAIAPPPDAIQEFNVQSHITDAQFAISSGANINVVTRSGTNTPHGALWEFIRNDALDALTFPSTFRIPYRQNQYGLYLGGPFTIPHIINGKNHTWFSLYWEGFRSAKSQTILGSTLTNNMANGNFSGILGTKQIGTDSLGRAEYANEIYDPETSRPDPLHPGESLRDPFPNNIIPANRINPLAPLIIAKYYPPPNLNVAEGVLPNLTYTGNTTVASDVFGIRLDHQITPNDTVFARFNRSNIHQLAPMGLRPTLHNGLSVYAQQVAFGYTHLFSPKTILNFRYGYTYGNTFSLSEPAGTAFAEAINFTNVSPARYGLQMGPGITIGNGYSAVPQSATVLGPQENMDYHIDLTKIVGNHSLGVGMMYYHLRMNDDGWPVTASFTQNATSQDGTAGPTGYSPASFSLGALDSYLPTAGTTAADQTLPWYGVYAQDQWQATRNLVLTAGLRWDYVAPGNFHNKIVSGLNVLTGQFIITGAYPPLFPAATGPAGYFYPQYNGFEPRFGVTYRASEHTVFHSGFAMLDDHNNDTIQKNQNFRVSWPEAIQTNIPSLDLGIPKLFINNLPSAASLHAQPTPLPAYAGNPHDKIPYSMQFNFGVQEQLSNSMALKVDYVGSLSRHQYINPEANTALYPGPGAVSLREPFPQFGNPLPFPWNEGPASYNALQVHLHKSLSSGLFFLASYTWQKSMDWQSDVYNASREQNFYDMPAEWGVSAFSIKNMFVLSGAYALPVGRGRAYLTNTNRFIDELVGNWNAGAILGLRSGIPFYAIAGSDVANVGNLAGSERGNRIAGISPYAAKQTHSMWLNKAAFAIPAPYTFGNESRDDLAGPASRNVDFNVFKNFPLFETASLQFRAEFFNLFNTRNFGNPASTLNASSFGVIAGAAAGREIQFALKVLF